MADDHSPLIPIRIARLSKELERLERKGRYRDAIEVSRNLSSLILNDLGDDGPAFASSLLRLAHLYFVTADYAAAEPRLRQATEVFRMTLGEEHPDLARALHDLAVLYCRIGDYVAAEPLFRQALDVFRTTPGEKSPEFASSLHELATLHHRKGDYAIAEPLFKRSLELRRLVLTRDQPELYQTITHLAALYRDTGDDAAAEPLLREALDVTRSDLGTRHPRFVDAMSQFAILLRGRSSHRAAVPLLQQAANSGTCDSRFVDAMIQFADLLSRRGDHGTAVPLLQQAAKHARKILGWDHPYHARALRLLAMIRIDTRDMVAAESALKELIDIRLAASGWRHPSYNASRIDLAHLYATTGREAEAVALLEQAATTDDKAICNVFATCTESLRTAYLELIRGNWEAYLSLVLLHLKSSDGIIRLAVDFVLRRKAIGAEMLSVQRDAILIGEYAELQPELRELSNLRSQIAQALLTGRNSNSAKEAHRRIAAWDRRKEQLEETIARRIPKERLDVTFRATTESSLANETPAGAGLG
jgi:tetratricopeptide (TPR) repeat protein